MLGDVEERSGEQVAAFDDANPSRLLQDEQPRRVLRRLRQVEWSTQPVAISWECRSGGDDDRGWPSGSAEARNDGGGTGTDGLP